MKLLFISNNLYIGGIQKSLVNLLNEISGKHEISLYLFYPEGELKKSLPETVGIIPGNKLTRVMGMPHAEAKRLGLGTFLWRSAWAVITRVFGIGVSFGLLSHMQKLDEEFDVAISYMQNSDLRYFYGGCNEFSINSVKAKKKMAFIHCDFRNFFGNNRYNRGFYKKFDKIACVSDSCKNAFLEVCPGYRDKTVTVHNCYNTEEMENSSGEYKAKYTNGAVNLFTAARISEEKGILRMLPILRRLKEKGFNFVWRVAGDGPLYNKALEECEKYALSDRVEFLGMLANPYPYFASADLLVVPSFDEAAPMVFGEAAYFSLPILTTETVSANELVEAAGIGFVCENSEAGLSNKLEELIKHPGIIREKSKEIRMSNAAALKEFADLIGEV